jgi:hypothetical protein
MRGKPAVKAEAREDAHAAVRPVDARCRMTIS